jgi:hypothetical protein
LFIHSLQCVCVFVVDLAVTKLLHHVELALVAVAPTFAFIAALFVFVLVEVFVFPLLPVAFAS